MTPTADLEMQIVARDGKIALLFSRREKDGTAVPAQTDNFDFVAAEAPRMMELIGNLAFEIDNSLKAAGPTVTAALAERHRITLTQRVALMLGTLREDHKKTHGQVAKEIVDACLKEIFV
jgi:hypothetical protein